MKRFALLLLLALMALVPLTSMAADQRDFNVINSSGYPIKFIGINTAGDEIWNENELSGILPNGSAFRVFFSSQDKGCTWNMKVTWADDNRSQIFRGLNLCAIRNVKIKYDRNSDEASIMTD